MAAYRTSEKKYPVLSKFIWLRKPLPTRFVIFSLFDPTYIHYFELDAFNCNRFLFQVFSIPISCEYCNTVLALRHFQQLLPTLFVVYRNIVLKFLSWMRFDADTRQRRLIDDNTIYDSSNLIALFSQNSSIKSTIKQTATLEMNAQCIASNLQLKTVEWLFFTETKKNYRRRANSHRTLVDEAFEPANTTIF